LAIGCVLAAAVASCSGDDDPDTKFKVTQANVDVVSTSVVEFIGGAFAHGGPDGISVDSTVRFVFASLENHDGVITVGTIVTEKNGSLEWMGIRLTNYFSRLL
jgi:hypothetical protein